MFPMFTDRELKIMLAVAAVALLLGCLGIYFIGVNVLHFDIKQSWICK